MEGFPLDPCHKMMLLEITGCPFKLNKIHHRNGEALSMCIEPGYIPGSMDQVESTEVKIGQKGS